MDSIVKKVGVQLGLIGAVALTVISIYTWQQQDFQNIALGITSRVIPIILGIIAQLWAKRRLNGQINFKQCVLAFLITVAIIFAVEALVNYAIYVLIDPNAQQLIEAAKREATINAGLDPDKPSLLKKPTYSLGSYIFAFATSTLFYLVIGLLSGFFIKTRDQKFI